MKETIKKIGWKYAIYLLVAMGMQVLLSYLFQFFLPDFMEKNGALMSFIIVVLSVDVLGFLTIYALTRNMEKTTIEKKKMGVGKFIVCIFVMVGILGVGMIIGLIIHNAIMNAFGISLADSSKLTTLMLNSDLLPRFIVIGLLQPVFEELAFRKVLVDHTLKYGEFTAIVLSGLMFGMFHGNFQQCFFAAGIGMFFAFIYIRTGKIGYSIALHMIVNSTTSVITVSLVSKVMEALDHMDANYAGPGVISEETAMYLPAIAMYIGWLLLLGLFAIVGIILFFVFKNKYALVKGENEPTNKEILKEIFTNRGMLVFYLGIIILFIYYYASQIIPVKVN